MTDNPSPAEALKMLLKFFDCSGAAINTRWNNIHPAEKANIVHAAKLALPAAEAIQEVIEDLIVALQKAYLPGFVALKRSDVIELIERARAALPEKGEE